MNIRSGPSKTEHKQEPTQIAGDDSMSSTETEKIRDPHDIRKGERYAYEGMYYWSTRAATTSSATGNDRHRVIEPDELKRLPVGSVVVNVATGKRHTLLEEHGLMRIDGWPINVRALKCMLFALISLPEPESKPESEPDGSWERPWPSDWPQYKDGWYNCDYRVHYQEGSVCNPNGPREVSHGGERVFHINGRTSVLAPGVFTEDLPGGGADAPWAYGFDGG